jgi:hypothetical protein
VWEITITTLFTYAVMSFVDHERPVRAVWQTFTSELSTPRSSGKSRPVRVLGKVRVRARPRHDRRLTRAYFAGTDHPVPTHAERYVTHRSGTDPTQQRRRRGIRKGRAHRPSTTPDRAVPASTAVAATVTTTAAAESGRAEGIGRAEAKPRSSSARLHGRPGSKPRSTLQSPNRAGPR